MPDTTGESRVSSGGSRPPADSAPQREPVGSGIRDAAPAETPPTCSAVDADAAHARQPEPCTTPQQVQAATSNSRWWFGVLAGSVASAPCAWLLSYAGTLPLFLGIFFFALFGLMVGALVHRIAAPGRPYESFALLGGTAIIVLLGWSLSVVKESRDFPSERATYASRKTRDLGGQPVDEYQELIARQIREYLSTRYPPGGALGYARWALSNGVIRAADLDDLRITLRAPQKPVAWAARVLLSLALFAFGVGSQTLPLRFFHERTARAMDNPDRP